MRLIAWGRLTCLAAVAGVLGCGLGSKAADIVYLSNFTNAQGTSQSTSPTYPVLGQKFKTGANADGYILDSVMMRVGKNLTSGDGEIVVSLRADAGASPGAVLATFSGTSPTNNVLTNLVYKAPAGTALQGNTAYWITMTSSSTNTYFWRFSSTNYSYFAAIDEWSLQSNNTFNASAYKNLGFYIEFRGAMGVKYFQDFSGLAVGATAIGDGSTLYSTSLGGATEIQDPTFKVLQMLTNGFLVSYRSALLLPDLDPGGAVNAFSAKWSAQLHGGFPINGRGYSVNFGQLAGLSLTSSSYSQEDGYDTGLSVGVNVGTNAGFYVRVNGALMAAVTNDPTVQWGTTNGTPHLFELDWHHVNGITLAVDGKTVLSNVNTYGFIPQAGDRFVWAANGNGFGMLLTLDNILVATGGNLVKEQITSPYTSSPGSIGVSSAFNSNPSNSWDVFAQSGYIGGTLSAKHQIVAYAVAGGSTDGTSWPRSWTLQGSTNAGSSYFTCAATTAYFRAREHIVVTPATNVTSLNFCRLNISTNSGNGAVTRVSILNPYGFVPVSGPTGWEKTAAPTNVSFWYGLAASADGSRFYASGYGQGIYRSGVNDLDTWTLCSGTSATNGWRGLACSDSGSRIIAMSDIIASHDGVYRSDNSGSSFAKTTAVVADPWDVASSADGNRFIGCGKVFVANHLSISTDGGLNWADLPNSPIRQWSSVASSADGTRLAATSDDPTNSIYLGRIWISSDSGTNWTQASPPASQWKDVAMSRDGSKLFATAWNTNGSSGWIYVSTNGGSSWTQASVPGLPYSAVACSGDGVIVIAVTDFVSGKFMLSQDSGLTWTTLAAPATHWHCVAMSDDGSRIVAGGNYGLWTYRPQYLPPSVIDRPGFYYTYPSKAETFAYVNPHGLPATAWFAIGTNTNFSQTNYVSAGSGTANANVQTIFSNLMPATTYFYRTFATNRTGLVRYGDILSLTTPTSKVPVVNLARNGNQLSGVITGSVYAIYYLQSSTSLVSSVWGTIYTNYTDGIGNIPITVNIDDTNKFFRAISQ